jgi:hypothetical protein
MGNDDGTVLMRLRPCEPSVESEVKERTIRCRNEEAIQRVAERSATTICLMSIHTVVTAGMSGKTNDWRDVIGNNLLNWDMASAEKESSHQEEVHYAMQWHVREHIVMYMRMSDVR